MTFDEIELKILEKSCDKFNTARYIKFIFSLKDQPKIKGVTEYHHILPKSKDLYPEYTNLKQFIWNGVYLTKRQHWVAHWMLHKIFGGSQSQAFFRMCKITENSRITSRTYEIVRNSQSKIAANFCKTRVWTVEQRKLAAEKSKGNSNALGKFRSDEQKLAASIKLTGIKHTPEQNLEKSMRQLGKTLSNDTKRKISKTLIGHKHSEETKAKQSNSKKCYYKLISPGGEIFFVFGLNAFCEEHSLNSGNMHQVALGKLKHHKKWVAEKIEYIKTES